MAQWTDNLSVLKKFSTDTKLTFAYQAMSIRTVWKYNNSYLISDIEWSRTNCLNSERTQPVYQYKFDNSSTVDNELYTNPQFPIHVVTGAAGNREGYATFVDPKPDWSIVRQDDYSETGLNYFLEIDFHFSSFDRNFDP